MTLLLGVAFLPACAWAQVQQQPVVINGTTSTGAYTTCPVGSGAAGACSMPVTASVSASVTGFPTTQTTGTPISVTTGGVTGTLPAGTVVVASNVGTTNNAYCKLGASATTSDQLIAPNSWFAFTVGASTQLTCITSTSTTTVNMVGGSGLATGAGGGGGGGGGGGAVTIADGADVTLGAKADAKSTATDTTPITAMQVLKQISASVQAPPSQAVTNAGTFAVQLTGATNNINNIAGTVSLPTGASTAALQPTNSAQGATTSGQTGHLVMGAVTTASPTYTTAQTSPLSLDTSGNLRVNIVTGASSGAVAQGSTTSGQTVVPAACATTTSAPTNTTAQTNMLNCDTAGALRVNVTSATGVAQGSTTSGQSVSPIGCRTLTSAPTDTTAQTNMPWCSTKGSLVVAQPTAADLNVTAALASGSTIQQVPGTANGLTFATVTAANSTNATNLKGSAGQLYHMTAYNNSATLAWVSLYNTAGTPTCGTGIVYQMMIPANSTSGAGAIDDIPSGLTFSTGIGYCIATGIAGTGSVAATSYVVNFGYK